VAITPGIRFDRYEIRSLLGRGGMGEVYLAEDTRLGRQVALKILPEEFTRDESRLRRFVQEAKSASSLNHPNIITIHEIGEANGAHFIATEFIDGLTLRQRMNVERLSLREAISVAIEVASALAAAHAVGLAHRDIKPENVMLRPDGYVKVLDFGLAKSIESEPPVVDTQSPTELFTVTEPGFVMGTIPYMSPEQARGLKVDARTDIWSLGVTLYEMIAGKAPFNGDTSGDIIASILKTEPLPLARYAPAASAELGRIVTKALMKDREQRYQLVEDMLLDLKSLRHEQDNSAERRDLGAPALNKHTTAAHDARTVSIEDTEAQQVAASTRSIAPERQTSFLASSRLWLAAALVVLFFAGLTWYLRSHRNGPETNPLASLVTTWLADWKSDLGEDLSNWARFSPDGKYVAFSSTRGGSSGIWIRQLDGGEPITSKRDKWTDFSPVWSPNGQIAFLSNRGEQSGIWTMTALGGTPMLLKSLERRSQCLVAWSKDGKTIYYELDQNLYSVNVDSKQTEQLTSFVAPRFELGGFSLSRDEERIAYADWKNEQKDIWVMPKHGGQPLQVTNDLAEDNSPVWLPDGKRIIYSSLRNGVTQICVAYLDGRPPTQITSGDSNHSVLDVSPDGTKILYATARDESDIWGVRWESGKETQLTSDIGVELWPDVAPDNARIAFQASRAISVGTKLLNCLILTQPAAADGQRLQLAIDGFEPRWSPDGKQLAFLHTDDKSLANLWTVGAEGGNARQLTRGEIIFGGFSQLPYNRFQTQDYQWSPDGHQLVYCARSSGVSNVWQVGDDGSGETRLSNNEDQSVLFFNPVLSPDRKGLAWLARMPSSANPKKQGWGIWVRESGRVALIFESSSALRLVGWANTGGELIVKSIETANDNQLIPSDVKLLSLPSTGLGGRPIAQLKAAFFHNIQLSPDRKFIAFAARKDGEGSLQVIPASGGDAKKILTSSDSRVYFSNLAWSPDGKTLYYGKQANWRVISMIDNFR
jgi:eukaryotic-like serine/threonine-protein kinase